jgi:chemotaxis protein methyltransferase CheR
MSGSEPVNSATACELRPREFARIQQMTYDFCGVDLHGKEVLVGARLGKKIRELNIPSFTQYCDCVQQDTSGKLFTEMIDALTTNHTSFFRESRHFDFLRDKIVPGLSEKDPLPIWSAACSSGEEPYSIAFSLIGTLGEQAFSRVSITATDISTRVLDKARKGIYPLSSLSTMSDAMRRECLMKGVGRYDGHCQVRPNVKAMIDFQQLNLLQDCSSVGPFQVIFCRNVMIYFDVQTQQAVVDRLASRLIPGGYLLIGHAESLNGIRHSLQYICTATYRKPGGSSGASSTRDVRSLIG